MIRNQWYVVLDSKELGRSPFGVTRLGEKLVFWRSQDGKVNCIKDQCVHRGAKLSIGNIIDDKLKCPFHGFEYDKTGIVTKIPAYGKNYEVPDYFKLTSYKSHEDNGFIYIFWGDKTPSANPNFFPDIDDSFSFSRLQERWSIHYSRAIENQLDVVHLPFVHYNTIGRGNKTIVDGPIVKWIDENKFMFFVYNRIDDGTLAKKPDEMAEPDIEKDFKLAFLFPNLWQNYIHPKARVVLAFVPIDDGNTMLYLRFYQKFVRIPLLRNLISNLAMPYNRRILHQDKFVVETQIPIKSEYKMNEKLIQGDLPIIEYRKRRNELLNKNQQVTA
jgi:phenylpropionate dioxygenase-like ring-hydroxylating dioxygenase large terminal subunit